MTIETIQSEVMLLASAVLRVPIPENGDLRRDETSAWDSLTHVDLMFTIEDRFSVHFTQEQLASLNSVAEIAQAVEHLRAA